MGDEFGGVGVHCKWQPWNPYLRADGRNPGKRNGSRNVTEWTCIVHWRVETAISVCGQRECVELSGEREKREDVNRYRSRGGCLSGLRCAADRRSGQHRVWSRDATALSPVCFLPSLALPSSLPALLPPRRPDTPRHCRSPPRPS